MELIVIDQNKLKIMLTAPDMNHYDLRAERMNGADAETRRAFRHIFDDAREQIGFETEGERILVQLYTSRSGGCEIFVTKLGPDNGEPLPYECTPLDLGVSPDAEDALLRRIHGVDPLKTAMPRTEKGKQMTTCTAVYRFEGLPDLMSVSRRLLSVGYGAASSLYRIEHMNGESWYLSLVLPEPRPLSLAFLAEYAEEAADPVALGLYLSEHGHMVAAEHAVESIGSI